MVKNMHKIDKCLFFVLNPNIFMYVYIEKRIEIVRAGNFQPYRQLKSHMKVFSRQPTRDMKTYANHNSRSFYVYS